MARKKIDFAKLIREKLNLILFGLILLVVFNKLAVQLVLAIIFTITGIYSLKFGRFIPSVSIETISASAILFGYVWGWKYGLIFGFAAGAFGYISISMINIIAVINIMFMGLCGVWAAMFAALGFSFQKAFILSFVLRAILGFPTFQAIISNPVSNIVHAVGDSIFNIIVLLQLMTFIHYLVTLIV